MKKRISLLLAALLLTLCACGSTASKEPLQGVYVAESAKLFGMKVKIDRVFEKPFVVELREDGTATLTYNEEDYELTWKVSKDNSFRAEGDDDMKLQGAVKDDIMVLENVMDSGAYVTLRKGIPIPTPVPVEEKKPFEWWSGDWYGWWKMTDCIGTFNGWQPDRKDAMCHVTMTDPGQFNVIIWDEEMPQDKNLADFSLTVSDDGSENGSALNGKGSFMEQRLDPGELTVTASAEYTDTMVIQGSYTVPNGSFNFVIMLRHWGTMWDDAASEDVPDHYDEWYLPLIEKGEKLPSEFVLKSK